jgi:hypothetical protein
VNSARCLFAFTNRIHDLPSAIGAIATCEKVRDIRLASGRIVLDHTSLI